MVHRQAVNVQFFRILVSDFQYPTHELRGSIYLRGRQIFQKCFPPLLIGVYAKRKGFAPEEFS